MGYWYDDLLMFVWKNSFQNLFRVRFEENCINYVMQVTDEISFPDYVDVEEDTKDFIIKSLKKDPDDRITLKDMLRHPFITKYK